MEEGYTHMVPSGLVPGGHAFLNYMYNALAYTP